MIIIKEIDPNFPPLAICICQTQSYSNDSDNDGNGNRDGNSIDENDKFNGDNDNCDDNEHDQAINSQIILSVDMIGFQVLTFPVGIYVFQVNNRNAR